MSQQSRRLAVLVLVVPAAIALSLFTGAAAGGPPQYGVRAAVPLVTAMNGLDGRLELLEDVRIRPEFRASMRGDQAMYCYRGGEDILRAFCASVSGEPLRRALLRIATRDGGGVVVQELERELGELTTLRLYADRRPTYAVTVDLSVGFGSYAGPRTRLA
jgi:hypothetical protein